MTIFLHPLGFMYNKHHIFIFGSTAIDCNALMMDNAALTHPPRVMIFADSAV